MGKVTVQEIGRAGRDSKQSVAVMFISEPTGWLDPEDKQRQHFFEEKRNKQHSCAQQLAKKLTARGKVSTVARHPDGAIALALLHSAGCLDWEGPFDYVIHQGARLHFPVQLPATQQMTQYLTTNQCRWQFLLSAFGFSTALGCGHCDRCNKGLLGSVLPP